MTKKIKTFSSVDIDQISLDKVYKTSNRLTKSTVSHQGQPLIIQGPQMILGENATRCGDYIYVDLVFDPKSRKNKDFLNFVKKIDNLVISEIYDNSESWYAPFLPNEPEIPSCLCQVESQFVPTIKSSILHQDQNSLKLKARHDQVEFFDQDDIQVPHLLLKSGYRSIPILEVSHVYRNDEHIWIEWNLLQVKTEVPEDIIKDCQLVDVVDSSDEDDEDAIVDDQFY